MFSSLQVALQPLPTTASCTTTKLVECAAGRLPLQDRSAIALTNVYLLLPWQRGGELYIGPGAQAFLERSGIYSDTYNAVEVSLNSYPDPPSSAPYLAVYRSLLCRATPSRLTVAR